MSTHTEQVNDEEVLDLRIRLEVGEQSGWNLRKHMPSHSRGMPSIGKLQESH